MSRLKSLSNWEWVALARSNDVARPVLTAIEVTESTLTATDGQRLHQAPNDTGLKPGLYDPMTLRPIEGTYPNYRVGVLDQKPKAASHVLMPGGKVMSWLRALTAAAKTADDRSTFMVTWPTAEKAAHFSPGYVYDALRMGIHGSQSASREIRISEKDHLAPAFLECDDRLAVVMPVRVACFTADDGEGERVGHVPLDDHLEPVHQPVKKAKKVAA